MSDKTRLTSVLNSFKNVSVRSPHWRSNFENRQHLNREKFEAKVCANQEKSYHIQGVSKKGNT